MSTTATLASALTALQARRPVLEQRLADARAGTGDWPESTALGALADLDAQVFTTQRAVDDAQAQETAAAERAAAVSAFEADATGYTADHAAFVERDDRPAHRAAIAALEAAEAELMLRARVLADRRAAPELDR